MKFGVIGLGRIGGALSLQAMEKGHQVVGYSLSDKELKNLESMVMKRLFYAKDGPQIGFS